jgi:hypothetical protein
MKKILILVLLWIVLFSGEGGLIPAPKPKVNVNDFISDFEAMGYAGLFQMIPSAGADEVTPPKPDVVSECKCNKSNGKISYDGGTSWTDCPCKIGECNCGCVNSKKTTENVEVDKPSIVRNYSDLYYVLRVTAPWCGPCKVWATKEAANFENAQITVKDVDLNSELAKKTKTLNIPHFVIVTKADDLFHPDNNNKIIDFNFPLP